MKTNSASGALAYKVDPGIIEPRTGGRNLPSRGKAEQKRRLMRSRLCSQSASPQKLLVAVATAGLTAAREHASFELSGRPGIFPSESGLIFVCNKAGIRLSSFRASLCGDGPDRVGELPFPDRKP